MRSIAEPVRVMPDPFYETALWPDERMLYRQAHGERGLHGEIALLRLRLYRLLESRAGDSSEEPATTTQVLRLVDLLIKALRTETSGHEQLALERALEEEALRVLGGAP